MEKERLKEYAKQIKIDIIGVASIDRFNGISAQNHPGSIFPEAKSIIVIGKRITRGSLRGIEEGTQFGLYNMYGYHWLNNRILALATFKMCEFLEDHGYEAVPIPGISSEIQTMGIPVKKGAPAPNVMVDIQDTAIRAGLGEIGYCGIFLTENFGPRQRFQLIITDSEIEPDPIKKENVCDLCMECAKICPLAAISHKKKTIHICGKKMTIADVDYDKCAICRNGVSKDMYYENAKPDRIAALCSRTCLAHLEEKKRIKNLFNKNFRKRKAWKIDKSGEVIR
ncbi:MAG TPA: hypothetical protein P5065_01580 [Candidatus Ratteibacteria bacterium]|nr:hypothetical protein [bacterium]HOQ81932.1 hypothetical protein [bacterium]HPC29245.1 hypothetical protein [bacterium]HRS05719.1 hypothetical protein [Candidatus Ratteibacteria bacterium]HRV03467.1 hypothetical protein [Candidatus Ratteibacteria bacterium]